MEPYDLTATQAVSAIREGDLTAEAYAESLVARAKTSAELNALIAFDEQRVLSAARAADSKRASGGDLGPLHGLPIVLKDNIDTADYPTTAGTPALRGNRPILNAPVAQALLDAGAIVLGKANLHELAYGVTTNNGGFGPARNPYDLERIPGGSSGGTGVAVAARLAPAGLGSDTGGSVRIPAALCGIVGLRPTLGRYSQEGIVPISHTRDTAGPMTRTVADTVLLDGVITGGPTELEAAELSGLRIGVPRSYFFDDLDREVADIVEGFFTRLRSHGVELVEADIPGVGAADEAASMPVALFETIPDLERYLLKHETGLDFERVVAAVASPDVKGMLQSLLGDGAIPEPVYRDALDTHRPKLQSLYRDYFRDHSVRAVMFPTTPLPAAKIGEDETVMLNGKAAPTFPTYIRNTDPASNAGIPGLSIPAGLTNGGLPVGVEIDGPEGSDGDILSIALAIEEREEALPGPNL